MHVDEAAIVPTIINIISQIEFIDCVKCYFYVRNIGLVRMNCKYAHPSTRPQIELFKLMPFEIEPIAS